MTKQLELTDEIRNSFTKKFGEDVDINKFYIIEARALSTEPIHQSTIYDGAVASVDTLYDMEHLVNDTDENIGIHIMHEDAVLNIGRVFSARVINEDSNVTALYAKMAIFKNEDTKDIIDKLENNVLDEVSVQFVPTHAKCSKCDFDYMGEGVDFMNWFTRTCPNDHTIGVDGCHLELDRTKSFVEISVVNRGAAHNPKIQSQKKRTLFSEGDLKALAASGLNPEIIVATFNSKMEKKAMSEENQAPELSAEQKVAELEAKLAEAQKKLDLEARVSELEAKLSETNEVLEAKDKELADAKAEAEASIAEKDNQLSESEEKLAAATKEKDECIAFLRDQVSKVNVAAGKKDVEVPQDLEGISAMLNESQQILVSLIPAGGVSKQINLSEKKDYTLIKMQSYQVKKGE